MEAIKELAKTINRINSLVSDEYARDGIVAARRIRETTVASLNAVSITAKDSYRGEEFKSLQVEAAKVVREELRARYDEQGKRLQFDAIMDVAEEIEQLHGLLPRLAGKAAVEAWAIARDLRKEAHDGQN